MKDTIFPKNFFLAEGLNLVKLIARGDSWQIHLLSTGAKSLLVTASLFNFWESLRLVSKIQFKAFLFENACYYYLFSERELRNINEIHDFISAEEGYAYAISLKDTRNIIPNISLKNGIYVECISRILPMPNEIEYIPDEIILGTWLTGGLTVSALSARRLLQLQPLLDHNELSKIVTLAGLNRENPSIGSQNNNAKLIASQRKSAFSLPGRRELENFFLENVIDIIENPSVYSAMNISFPGAFILYGPPGCGKTYAVDRLVEYLDWPVFYVESGTIGSSYIHETSKKISLLFKEAMENAPSVLVIDEMESFLSSRSQSAGGNNHHKEEMAEFLRKIPEASKNKVLIIGMTNMIESIDPAIRRRGRFDHSIEVGMPSYDDIYQLITSLLNDLPHDEYIDIHELSVRLQGNSVSDVAFIVKEAARLTARNHLKSITQENILIAIQNCCSLENNTKRTIGFISE